ncbi:MAG TPA: hypothetical protein PLN31_05380 [Azoarcus taiwanensis]|nr:hypothetical protein [Azoarcus taiwanensis]HRQ56830.1 hypothetical protein [Azoarcus taiwanensis]
MSTGWIQFLLVVVPVLSLIGSWLALRAVAGWQARKDNETSPTGWKSHE